MFNQNIHHHTEFPTSFFLAPAPYGGNQHPAGSEIRQQIFAAPFMNLPSKLI
jgi:hypothetical protein